MGLFRRKKKTEKNESNKVDNKSRKNENSSEDHQRQEAVLTLYSCRKDGEAVFEVAKQIFSEVMDKIYQTDEGEFFIRLKDGTDILFTVVANQPENKVQANGMANFFSKAPLENQAVKESVLRQILLFNCIVGIRFQLDDQQQRTGYIITSIYGIAKELSAFVLYPNMDLHHSDGRLLLSIDGKSDFDEFYPQASTTLLEREAKEEEVDVERKKRSIAVLKEKNIPFIEHLKAAVFESEAKIWEKEAVIHRLIAVFACCIQAEVYTNEKFENCKEMMAEEMEQMEELYQVKEWLSQEEKDYLEQPEENSALHNKFGWRYECCSVLMWALSLIELKNPDEICDASEIGGILWNNNFDSLMEKAVLRSKEELLDMQDLILRYNWACVDARIHHREVSGLNGEIVFEWHYALNWLVGADGITDWDRVTTTT